MELDTSKSNLNIKKHIRKRAKNQDIIKERKTHVDEIVRDVDVVFGLDNGATGTICGWILPTNEINFIETPSKKELNYQKEITYIDRIDFHVLKGWFEQVIDRSKEVCERYCKGVGCYGKTNGQSTAF